MRPPFPSSESRADGLLHLVHTALCGPMGVRSEGGAQNLIVLVDDRSRYTCANFLKNKSDALVCLKDWIARVERFTERKAKVVGSDNVGEYTSKDSRITCSRSAWNANPLPPTLPSRIG